MAITRTRAHTTTHARTALIKMQVSRVLERSSINKTSIDKVLLGIDRRWISEVSVYGLDSDDICHVELYMKIDWDRNQFHIAAGRDTVDIDVRWRDGIAIEIEKALALFEEFSGTMALRKIFHVKYATGIDVGYVRQQLGFRRASPVRWRGGTMGTALGIPELDEFTVGVNIAG